MRLIIILHRLNQYENDEFIIQLFWHILNRLPSENERQHYSHLLTTDTTRVSVIVELLESQEAVRLARKKKRVSSGRSKQKIYLLLRDLYQYNDQDFVRNCYKQVLCREPDHSGFKHYIKQLSKRKSQWWVLKRLITSKEAEELLHADMRTKLLELFFVSSLDS